MRTDNCSIDCSTCPRFAVFSSNATFVDYLEAPRFNREGSKDIHVDESGFIRIEECGIYAFSINVNVKSRSSWALFRVGLPDTLLPYTFMTNSLSEENTLKQSYSLDSQEFLAKTVIVGVSTPQSFKLVNITADDDGRAGYDFQGTKVSNIGNMVKIYSEDNVVRGVPFPGITISVFQIV